MEALSRIPNRADRNAERRTTIISTPRDRAMFPGWGVRV